jgi:hypothetical protein
MPPGLLSREGKIILDHDKDHSWKIKHVGIFKNFE